jgi:hypothetical protein
MQPTFIEAHQASKMIGKVKFLESRIKRSSFFEEMITSRNEVFKDFVSDIAVEIRKLGNSTRMAADSNETPG